ncbi:MAG: LemA family protein [Saprospiraceae bacterium]|nr:LemA family protein [Saprospiraceae bacterium]
MTIRKFFPLILLGVFLLLVFNMCGSYNTAVQKDEGVKAAWSQVENQYQRRSDLIPNLVNTVQGYADFERQTLEAVIQARANATKVTVDPNNISPESIQQFEQSQGALSGALGRLLVTVERYPDLKANENFRDLQTQLEGTENRIGEARRAFNTSVNDYNAYIRRFPTNLFTGIFGFSPKGYFQATPGSEKAPEVKFSK